MKKTCSGCKAINDNFNYCILGYKIEVVTHTSSGLATDIKPKEQCPKPRTNKELIKLLE